MKPGLLVELVHQDPDFLELVFRVDNGRFSGRTAIYLHADAAGIAAQLAGFPRDPSDERQISLQGFEGDCAVGLRLHCVGGAIQSWMDVRIADLRRREEVSLSFQFAPSALDVFVAQLRIIETSGSAFLAAES